MGFRFVEIPAHLVTSSDKQVSTKQLDSFADIQIGHIVYAGSVLLAPDRLTVDLVISRFGDSVAFVHVVELVCARVVLDNVPNAEGAVLEVKVDCVTVQLSIQSIVSPDREEAQRWVIVELEEIAEFDGSTDCGTKLCLVVFFEGLV